MRFPLPEATAASLSLKFSLVFVVVLMIVQATLREKNETVWFLPTCIMHPFLDLLAAQLRSNDNDAVAYVFGF